MKSVDILLIYPRLGIWDNILRDIPLSLVYAATDSVKNGYNVKILDCRLYPDTWQEKLDGYLNQGCQLAGISVMTGYPIITALEVSRYIKKTYSSIPIVWGGPQVTILPELTLKHEDIDYIIRDWGSYPLYQLISHIKKSQGDTQSNVPRLEDIIGLGYKKDGSIILNEAASSFELLDYNDLPYHLVEIDSKKYNRFRNENSFPIFTSIGCPYKCTYCMSPKAFSKIKGKKWIAMDIDKTLDHIQYIMDKYNFQRIQIYDDDSFVDLSRMKEFLRKYIERGFNKKVKLDFRGARINELDKMDEDYLQIMVMASVEVLMIGVESGSDETLKRLNKGITGEQIIRVNKKLAAYPSLIPNYNIFCGSPGETYKDLVMTKNIMMTLAKDNPSCYIGGGVDWKPMPGTVLTEIAERDYNLKLPDTLLGWVQIDSWQAGKLMYPWYTKKTNNYIKLLQIAGLLIDCKLEMFEREISKGKGLRLKILKLMLIPVKIYRPVLQFRLRYNISSFLIEYPLRNFFMKIANKLSIF